MSEENISEDSVEREYMGPTSGINGHLHRYWETPKKNGVQHGLVRTYTSGDGETFSLDCISLYQDGKLIAYTTPSDQKKGHDIMHLGEESRIEFYRDGSVSGIDIKLEYDPFNLKKGDPTHQVMFFKKGVVRSISDLTPENSSRIKMMQYNYTLKDLVLREGEVRFGVVKLENGCGFKFGDNAVHALDSKGTTVRKDKLENLSEKGKAAISSFRSLEKYKLALDLETEKAIQLAWDLYKGASHGKYARPTPEAQAFIEQALKGGETKRVDQVTGNTSSSGKPDLNALRGTSSLPVTPSKPVQGTTPVQNGNLRQGKQTVR